VKAWAVVLAGGIGSRFGQPKQFADLAGRPVVDWSLATARQSCAGVVLVLPAHPSPGRANRWEADAVVTGGETRSGSVRAGLAAVPVEAEIIAVHDAARPLAGLDLWQAVIGAVLDGADAAIPAAAVTDTIKELTAGGCLLTLDRSRLVAVQTPQAFRAGLLRQVHKAQAEATDDAALVEAAGGRVVLVEGPPENLKITSPPDLVMAAALLETRR
jgi:2-C-methyl-D-erythritol 4-phosphate cytidylyltransferase